MTLTEKKDIILDLMNLKNHKGAKGIKWTSVECMDDADYTHGGNVIDVVQEIGKTKDYDPMEDYVDIQISNGYLTYSKGKDYDNFLEFCDKCMENNVEFIVCSHEFSLNPERKARLKKMYEKGIIFICAAGNKGEEVSQGDTTYGDISKCEYVFLVTSFYFDTKGKKWWGGHNYGEDIKMIAPTMIPIDQNEDGKLDDSPNGTSFSAPFQMELLRICKKLNPKINSKTLLEFIDSCGTNIIFGQYVYKFLMYNEEKIKSFMKGDDVMITLPYKKGFRKTQGYSEKHTGVDLVGEDKYIYAIVGGTIDYVGWENPNNKEQGFGLYVRIKGTDGLYYYYGHLNWVHESLCIGKEVAQGDLLGLEGSTGKSTGSHLHLEIRKKIGKITDMANSVNVEQVIDGVLQDNEDVIDVLHKLDILGNKDYWRKQIKEVPYLDILLTNVVTYINEHIDY